LLGLSAGNSRLAKSTDLDEQSGMCFLLLAILALSFLINEVVLSTRSVSQIPRNFVTIGRGAHQKVRRSPVGINQTEIFIGFIHYHVGN
jgi:hypothetical protein